MSNDLYPLLEAVPSVKTFGPVSVAAIYAGFISSVSSIERRPISIAAYLKVSIRVLSFQYEFHCFLHVNQELSRLDRSLIWRSEKQWTKRWVKRWAK